MSKPRLIEETTSVTVTRRRVFVAEPTPSERPPRVVDVQGVELAAKPVLASCGQVLPFARQRRLGGAK